MPWFRRAPALPADAPTGERLADVLAAVRRIELQPGNLITDVLTGGYRSTFRGSGVEFHDVREYVEGDEPRTVDWNVTARLGRPFVKRYVEERERTLMFALDLSAPMASGLGAWSLRQAAARLCCCLGRMAIDNHDRVGLIAGAGAVSRFVLPRAGGGHVLRVLRDCVELPHEAGAANVESLLAHAAGRLARRTVLFVLSDFAGTTPWPSLLPCARRHDIVAVRLLAAEVHAPPPALLAVQDPVSGQRSCIDFAAAGPRAAYAERVQQWLAVRNAQFQRAGVDVLDLALPMQPDLEAIVKPLARWFRRRCLRAVRR